jgi:putative zinc finger protein
MTTCEQTQRALSERMDGGHLSRGTAVEVEAHVETCADCQHFRDRSARVRTAVRIRPAEPIPDLTEPIMAAIETERGERGRRGRRLLPRRGSVRVLTPRRAAPIAVALAAGLVAGSIAVGGPWQSPSSGPSAAAAVVRGVQAAAPTISSYQARFSIIERGLSAAIPERNLTMDVAFLSPGRFRIDVHDRTPYPSKAWTPTDLTYIANGTSTYTSGPSGCPSELPPDTCPPTRTAVTRHTRFDVGAPLATDLVLPLATLSSARGVRVLGTGEESGRPTVTVELTFARAAPLLPFLQLGGTWRPFFDQDRVVLTLDRTDWFPQRVTVYPSTSAERRPWELRFGLPVESASQPILDMQIVSFDARPPPAGRFTMPGRESQQFASLARIANVVGYTPITPAQTLGLRLTSAVAPPSAGPGVPTSLLTFSRGLSYLVIGQRSASSGSGLLGPIDARARQVSLPGGGIAYVETTTGGRGNVLSIHTGATDLFVQTDLPMAQLLAVAASIPVRGLADPTVGALP